MTRIQRLEAEAEAAREAFAQINEILDRAGPGGYSWPEAAGRISAVLVRGGVRPAEEIPGYPGDPAG